MRDVEEVHKQAAVVVMTGAAEAPCSFDTALEGVATDAALGYVERDDFGDWLLDAELWPDDESLGEWRGSAAHEHRHDRIAAFSTWPRDRMAANALGPCRIW